MEERIGPYTVVEELGRGGMGVVYKAHDPSLDRFVALKVLAAHLTQDADYVRRFEREARAAAALNHPNIVQIYTVGEDNGRHYFVMEYVDGTSVQQMIRREGRLDPARAAGIIFQAASGLAAAHRAGILHRDIKPGNLMVDERGIVKIADFGLALAPDAATRLTSTGMLMGTPGYLSPEQCLDKPADARSDIYSLGATFFEMLAGRTPHQADSPLALLRKIVEVEPPDVAELNPEVDPELRRIVSTMMAKDPAQRYQSCEQIVADLGRWMEASGAGSFLPGAGASRAAAAVASGAGASAQMEHTPTVMVPTAATERAAAPPPPPPVPAPGAGNEAPQPAPAPVQAVHASSSTPSRGRTAVLAGAALLVLLGLAAAGVVAWRMAARHGSGAAAADMGGTQAGIQTGTDVATAPQGFGDASGVEVEGSPAPESPQQLAAAGPAGTGSSTPAGADAAGSPQNAAAAGSAGAATAPAAMSADAPPGHGAGATSPPPPHAAAAAGAAHAAADAAARPPARGTVVLAVGEEMAAGEAARYLRERLARAGIELVEIDDFPRALDLVEQDPSPPTNAILSRLHGRAANLVLVRIRYEGSRQLNYLGRGNTVTESGRIRMTGGGLETQRTYTGGNPDQAHRARMTVTCYDLSTTHTLAPRWSTTVEYTPLNVGRNVEKALGSEAGKIIDLLGR